MDAKLYINWNKGNTREIHQKNISALAAETNLELELIWGRALSDFTKTTS